MHLQKKELTLDELLSVTNIDFPYHIFKAENAGEKGIRHITQSKYEWIFQRDSDTFHTIRKKEHSLRQIISGKSILIDIIGLIGSGKTTLATALTQSAGGCVVKTSFNGKKVEREAGFLGELPESNDLLPNGFEWKGLNEAKNRVESTLEDLYHAQRRVKTNASLRIQAAYLGMRGEQGELVKALPRFGYKIPIFRDGSPIADWGVFTKKFYEDGSISKDTKDIVDMHFKTSMASRKPDLVILYTTTVQDAYEGTLRRNRRGEAKSDGGLTLQYLESLTPYLNNLPSLLQSNDINVPVISLERVDFMSHPENYIAILDNVIKVIKEI